MLLFVLAAAVKPMILFFLLTWPMQLTLGDEGSSDRSSAWLNLMSLMDKQQNIGIKKKLFRRPWRLCLCPLPISSYSLIIVPFMCHYGASWDSGEKCEIERAVQSRTRRSNEIST